MSKSIKTKPSYNQEVLEIINGRYGYSYDYIRKSIRGDRVGIIPERIRAEYNKLNSESIRAISIQANKL